MSIRIQRYITMLALLLFTGKLWAWYITGSVTILTDAMESIVNVITGFVGLYSVIVASRPRDTNHPYGHGKAEFISAAVEGVLIMLAGLIIIYQGTEQLIHPQLLQKLDIGLVIIAGTGILNYIMGRYAVAAGKKNHSLVVESAGRHLLSDAYSTVAILIGITLVLLTRWPWLDSVVALCFSIIIIITGYKVLRRSLSGIMDEADQGLLQQVVALLQEKRKPQWVDMHNLRVIQYGDVMHVDTHMTLPWYYKIAEAEKEIHGLESTIRDNFGRAVELFIHTDACMPYQCKLCALAECPVRKEEYKCQIEWNLSNVWLNEKHGKPAEH